MPKALICSRIRVARPVRGCKRLRGYVLMLFAVPYFCPWKCQEQINMGAKETGTTCE